MIRKAMLVLILFAWAFTGCTSRSMPEETTAPPEPVRILSFPDQPKEHLQEIIRRAELDYPVEIIEVPQNQYEDKARLMLATGEPPDLVLVDAPNLASYVEGGWLEPLDSYWDNEDFEDLVDSCKASLSWNNSIWAAPLNEASCVLFYNREIFENEGIVPSNSIENAWNLDELLENAIKLTKTDKTGRIVQYGLLPSMFTPGNKNEGMAFTQMLFLWWFGGEIVAPDGSTVSGYFDSQANIDAVRFYADLFDVHKVSPLDEIQGGFTEGKIAMWINGPWMLGAWKEAAPGFFDGSWGAMPLPRGVNAASPTGSWNIAITRESKRKDDAWLVISALTGTDGMTYWCEKTGNVPARKSILENNGKYRYEPPYNIISEQLLQTGRARPMLARYPEISRALVECFNSAAYGLDPELAVHEAAQRMNEALNGTYSIPEGDFK